MLKTTFNELRILLENRNNRYMASIRPAFEKRHLGTYEEAEETAKEKEIAGRELGETAKLLSDYKAEFARLCKIINVDVYYLGRLLDIENVKLRDHLNRIKEYYGGKQYLEYRADREVKEESSREYFLYMEG